MPPEMSTGAAHADAAIPSRGAKRLFAAPSRQGLLVCAASLMPAYLFGLMSLMNLLGLAEILKAPPVDDPRGPAAAFLEIGHKVLSTGFSMLICWLFLVRRPSVDTVGTNGRLGDVVAVAGTGVVLGISLAPRTTDDLLMLAAAEALLLTGLVIMLIGLASLGRSFGIMPRARGLITSGLYRWVRHPIYLGEFLAFAGMLLQALSPWTVVVYGAFVFLQLWRVVQEEQTLAAAYPEYDEYRARTARLLPGVY